MKETYFRVWNHVKNELYQFIKLNEISLKNYYYQSYFQEITDKNKIKTIEHHFSNDAISGLFIKNKDGITLSYEKKHPVTRQNFTKCHELGHFMLNHSGGYFTENNTNNDELEDFKEIEANFYSAFILMPDIVLLQKIGYENKSFLLVADELQVSSSALHNRLMNILQYICNLNQKLSLNIVMNYRKGNNHAILKYLSLIKENIISEYYQIQYNPEEKLLKLMKEKDFISNFEMKELNEKTFQEKIKKKYSNISIWGYYNQGKNIYYAYKKELLTAEQALKKAKTFLLFLK